MNYAFTPPRREMRPQADSLAVSFDPETGLVLAPMKEAREHAARIRELRQENGYKAGDVYLCALPARLLSLVITVLAYESPAAEEKHTLSSSSSSSSSAYLPQDGATMSVFVSLGAPAPASAGRPPISPAPPGLARQRAYLFVPETPDRLIAEQPEGQPPSSMILDPPPAARRVDEQPEGQPHRPQSAASSVASQEFNTPPLPANGNNVSSVEQRHAAHKRRRPAYIATDRSTQRAIARDYVGTRSRASRSARRRLLGSMVNILEDPEAYVPDLDDDRFFGQQPRSQ